MCVDYVYFYDIKFFDAVFFDAVFLNKVTEKIFFGVLYVYIEVSSICILQENFVYFAVYIFLYFVVFPIHLIEQNLVV